MWRRVAAPVPLVWRGVLLARRRRLRGVRPARPAERAVRREDQADEGDVRANPGGNEQLTAFAGILLIVLLAVEGATLLNLRALLTVHAFIGMFLLPVVALKLGSTGWRMGRYYLGKEE